MSIATLTIIYMHSLKQNESPIACGEVNKQGS